MAASGESTRAVPPETPAPARYQAFNLQQWIEDHRHLLKPPVGNQLLHSGQFKIMVVAGPNTRTDYHIEDGEEWFYQLEGSMTLNIVDERPQQQQQQTLRAKGEEGNGGKPAFYGVRIHAGETFCLPARVPHSPQRDAGSIGIVVERERREGELDTLRWYCRSGRCRATVLYEETFRCADLVEDLPPIIRRYCGDERLRTCAACGWTEPAPE